MGTLLQSPSSCETIAQAASHHPSTKMIPLNPITTRKPQFTSESRDLLTKYALLDKTLVQSSNQPTPEKIQWTQPSKSVLGCEEIYLECDYFVQGQSDTDLVKVFVALQCGLPPQQFSTAGYTQKEAVLHFGCHPGEKKDTIEAIFFVIHPSQWAPHQTKFRTSGMANVARAVQVTVSRLPGPVGMAVRVAGGLTSACLGEYLLYIGGEATVEDEATVL